MRPIFYYISHGIISLFLISCASHKTTSILSGKIASSIVRETWGYGCGRDCAFNSDGQDKIQLVFGDGYAVSMKNEGHYLNVIHYPHSFILDAKRWQYGYVGTWNDVEGEIRIRLELEKADCSVQRSEGKKKVSIDCEKAPSVKFFICKREMMKIEEIEREVLNCNDETGGSSLFGIGFTVNKVAVGSPSIQEHYYTSDI